MLFDFLLPPSKENIFLAAYQLVRGLHVRVTATSLKQTLEGHPDYPSLLSISDSYKKWNIENSCVRVEKEQLAELPVPFLAYTNFDGGTFIMVHSTNGNSIRCSGLKKKGGSSIFGKEEFLREWTGVCLLAEASDKSGEPDYGRLRVKEWLRANQAVLILLACLVWISVAFTTLPLYWLSLLKLIGCLVTALLLWYEIDGANPVLQKLCTAVKNTNCKAVVGSDAANLFGVVTWSEIGFYYFTGSFLYLQVMPAGAAVSMLAWLNLPALPYTVFSVYYQWRVARQWCVLCLAVQVLLIAEAGTFFYLFWGRAVTHVPIADVHGLAVFLLPVFFWMFVKPSLIKGITGEKHKTEVQRLKSNRQIFESLIRNQKAIPPVPAGLGITLGNPSATNTLIKVCNPYCAPCAKAHPLIEELLQTRGNLKVQIIFTAKDDENDHRAKPVRHLMALEGRRDPALMHRALDDWYLAPKKDYEAFAGKYPLNGELLQQGGKLTAMNQWCTDAGVSFTPTIFINGYQLPEIYAVDDLKSFLEE